jgi:hypothetical protein
MQRICIDLDTDPRYGRKALTGDAEASIKSVLGDPLDIEVIFHRSGELVKLADGATGLFTVKIPTSRTDDPLFSDITMTEAAITSPAGFSYKFEGVLDTTELIGAVGPSLDDVELRCTVAWTVPGQPQRRCADLLFTLLNSSARPSDSLPARASQVEITNDYMRVLCPDGQWRRATLFNEE